MVSLSPFGRWEIGSTNKFSFPGHLTPKSQSQDSVIKLLKRSFLLHQVSENCRATSCWFLAPSFKGSKPRANVTVKLRVQETYLDCGSLQYLEDPRFTGCRVEPEGDTELEVKIQVCFSLILVGMCPPPHNWQGVLMLWVPWCALISPSPLCSSQKENDDFNISKTDIEITLFHGENKQLNCSFENITRNQDLTIILCKIKGITNSNSIDTSSKKVRVSHLPSLPVGFTSFGAVPRLNRSPSGMCRGSLDLHFK